VQSAAFAVDIRREKTVISPANPAYAWKMTLARGDRIAKTSYLADRGTWPAAPHYGRLGACPTLRLALNGKKTSADQLTNKCSAEICCNVIGCNVDTTLQRRAGPSRSGCSVNTTLQRRAGPSRSGCSVNTTLQRRAGPSRSGCNVNTTLQRRAGPSRSGCSVNTTLQRRAGPSRSGCSVDTTLQRRAGPSRIGLNFHSALQNGMRPN